MRQSGYYWVKYQGEWIISEYLSHVNKWVLMYGLEALTDLDFSEIDETPIRREEQQ